MAIITLVYEKRLKIKPDSKEKKFLLLSLANSAHVHAPDTTAIEKCIKENLRTATLIHGERQTGVFNNQLDGYKGEPGSLCLLIHIDL